MRDSVTSSNSSATTRTIRPQASSHSKSHDTHARGSFQPGSPLILESHLAPPPGRQRNRLPFGWLMAFCFWDAKGKSKNSRSRGNRDERSACNSTTLNIPSSALARFLWAAVKYLSTSMVIVPRTRQPWWLALWASRLSLSQRNILRLKSCWAGLYRARLCTARLGLSGLQQRGERIGRSQEEGNKAAQGFLAGLAATMEEQVESHFPQKISKERS